MTPQSLPHPLRQFVEGLEALYPGIDIGLERGGKASGIWWIDVSAASAFVVVQWKDSMGFSLEAVGEDDAVYGSPPSEHYRSVDLALKRMTQLLAEDELSAQVGGLALKELRELRGLSQSELGRKMDIKQAAVSRVERRADLHLDTLMAIIQALGGTLEIRAKFPDCEVPIKVGVPA